jgi:hypothetical protein
MSRSAESDVPMSLSCSSRWISASSTARSMNGRSSFGPSRALLI